MDNYNPPGRCMNLGETVAILAIVDLVCLTIGTIAFLVYFVVAIAFLFPSSIQDERLNVAVLIMIMGFFILVLIFIVVQFALTYGLYVGARKRILSKVRLWFVVMLIFWILSLLGLVSLAVKGVLPSSSFLGAAVPTIYRLIELILVKGLMDQLQLEEWGATVGHVIAFPAPNHGVIPQLSEVVVNNKKKATFDMNSRRPIIYPNRNPLLVTSFEEAPPPPYAEIQMQMQMQGASNTLGAGGGLV